MHKLKQKLKSQTGASITFALLLFLVCAVVGSAVLVAGTAAAGRMSKVAEMDQRYYAVNSAARLLVDLMERDEIRYQVKEAVPAGQSTGGTGGDTTGGSDDSGEEYEWFIKNGDTWTSPKDSDPLPLTLFLAKQGQNPRTQETKVTPATDRKGTFIYSKETGWSRTGYAVYPAAVAKSLTVNNALTLTLPAAYDLTTSTSVQLPMVAVNSGETSNLAFKAACGLLRIQCTGLTGTSVTVTMDKGITGDFAVANPGSAPTITAAGTTNKTVTFSLPSGATSAELNLPLPCGEYGGITVTNGSKNKTVSAVFTVKSGYGKRMQVNFSE